jgi:regulator of replication initiation timing
MEEVYSRSCVEVRVESPSAYFVNLADLHYGLNHRKLFLKNLDFLKSIPNLYFGLGGDAGNGITRYSKGNPLEEWASGSKQLYALAEDLQSLVDENRLLYIIKGNHLAGRMENETFHTPEELLAWLLGKPELYKGSQAIVYFNVNNNCYVHFAQHKSPKRQGVFDWVNADVIWREHFHENGYQRKLVMEHNKYVKKPIIKEVYEVQSGHWQILPEYQMECGIRPTPAGCWIAEMSGEKRKLFIWDNEQLAHMNTKGYQL